MKGSGVRGKDQLLLLLFNFACEWGKRTVGLAVGFSPVHLNLHAGRVELANRES